MQLSLPKKIFRIDDAVVYLRPHYFARHDVLSFDSCETMNPKLQLVSISNAASDRGELSWMSNSMPKDGPSPRKLISILTEDRMTTSVMRRYWITRTLGQ